MADDPRYNVCVDLWPGEMQFINNYHVWRGRTANEDEDHPAATDAGGVEPEAITRIG